MLPGSCGEKLRFASCFRVRRDRSRFFATRVAVFRSRNTGTMTLNQRGAAGTRHPPNRYPPDAPTLARALTPPCRPTAEPGSQRGGSAGPADDLHAGPASDVQRNEHQRKVALGQPDAVAGVETVVVAVPGGLDRWVVRHQVARVPRTLSLIPHSPREFYAFVSIEERLGPS